MGAEFSPDIGIQPPRLKPGGSGRPPVIACILSCISASALTRASLCAATIRSSRISLSSGLTRLGSMPRPRISPLAVRRTRTRPPPGLLALLERGRARIGRERHAPALAGPFAELAAELGRKARGSAVGQRDL